MAGLPGAPDSTRFALPSKPYIEENLAVVVRDFRAEEFLNSPALGDGRGLTFAMAPEGRFDALITGADTGSAWTLIYPEFQVVRPLDVQAATPGVYLMPLEARALRRDLDAWIDLRRGDRGGHRSVPGHRWIAGHPVT